MVRFSGKLAALLAIVSIGGCGGSPADSAVNDMIAAWSDLATAAEKKDAGGMDTAVARLLTSIDQMDSLPSDQVVAAAKKREEEINRVKERIRKADPAVLLKADKAVAERAMQNLKKKFGGK